MTAQRKPLLLMVMVDALRHDYITSADAPFLHAAAQAGASGSLAPSFGFEPDAAYFAGMTPEQADGGAQFWLQPGARLFRGVGAFALASRLSRAPRWQALLRKGLRAVAQLATDEALARRMAAPAMIPYEQLARFSLSLKHMADDPAAFAGRSLFDLMRSANKPFFFHGFPAQSVRTEPVLRRFAAELQEQHELAFVFMGDLDGIGHRHGPGSEQRRAMLRRIDAAISQMHAQACRSHAAVRLMVFGDHGMAQVQGLVDVRPAIQSAGLDLREDSWFLDSTMARFWVRNARRRERMRAGLSALRGGRLLSDEDKARYAIRWPHDWFGQEIFVVDDHALVHPSFYADDEPPQGMHGYLPGCRDNESAFVVSGAGIAPQAPEHSADMRRVYSTALGLLGLAQAAPADALPSLLQPA
jgi:predicted AlkP superfamily pyrophosphatase or phosphodiesterase